MVTSLNLAYNRLTGNLSGWHNASSLVNLTMLDLSFNELGGALPTELGAIDTLTILTAPHNRLSGVLPTELGAINSRSGTVDLTEIDLRVNSISGVLPSELGRHRWLRSLDLRENALSGTVPPQLFNDGLHDGFIEKGLVVLHLMDNPKLSGTLPTEVGKPTGLRFLDVSRGRLTGTLPTQLGKLGGLQTLHFDSNRLEGTVPTQIVELGLLRTLRLNNNNLTGNLPALVGKLRNLRVLDVYNNSMTGDMPRSIRDLGELEELYLANEHLLPLRRKYCGMRLPDAGRYSWRVIREEYDMMMASYCPDDQILDTEQTFNTLQDILPEDEL